MSELKNISQELQNEHDELGINLPNKKLSFQAPDTYLHSFETNLLAKIKQQEIVHEPLQIVSSKPKFAYLKMMAVAASLAVLLGIGYMQISTSTMQDTSVELLANVNESELQSYLIEQGEVPELMTPVNTDELLDNVQDQQILNYVNEQALDLELGS